MKITKVNLKNYKSFGKEDNTIKLDDHLTAILGKNESGKSNLISGLNELRFWGQALLLKKQNKLNSEPVELEVALDFEKEDKIDSSYNERTTVVFENSKFASFSGGFLNYFMNDTHFQECRSSISETLTKIDAKSDTSTKTDFVNWMKRPFYFFSMASDAERFKRLKAWIVPKLAESEKPSVIESIDYIIEKYDHALNILPSVFYYEPYEYHARYTLEEVSKINESLNKPLKQLLSVMGIDTEELKKAMQSTTDAGLRCVLREKIKEKTQNFSKEFNKFYNGDPIEVFLSIENEYFDLLFSSCRFPMPLSDRSLGVRWYFDFFVQLKSQDLLDKKLLILLDEPGIHLHISAQNSLLQLLKDLSQKNQIVYTTQSPYMIDIENLCGIRLVENVSGYTHIYNHFYSAPISNASRIDILSPLTQAIGFPQRFNFAPDNTRTNVLVEGPSDYYYLMGAAKLFGVQTNNLSVISCNGVSNIHLIASILLGWGYDFKILMDHDNKAYEETKELNKMGLKAGLDYFTYNLHPIDHKQMKQEPFLVEDLFTEQERKSFAALDKVSASAKFCELVSSQGINLSEETKERFLNIFKALNLIKD